MQHVAAAAVAVGVAVGAEDEEVLLPLRTRTTLPIRLWMGPRWLKCRAEGHTQEMIPDVICPACFRLLCNVLLEYVVQQTSSSLSLLCDLRSSLRSVGPTSDGSSHQLGRLETYPHTADTRAQLQSLRSLPFESPE